MTLPVITDETKVLVKYLEHNPSTKSTEWKVKRTEEMLLTDYLELSASEMAHTRVEMMP